jgi:hypothetical protein
LGNWLLRWMGGRLVVSYDSNVSFRLDTHIRLFDPLKMNVCCIYKYRCEGLFIFVIGILRRTQVYIHIPMIADFQIPINSYLSSSSAHYF